MPLLAANVLPFTVGAAGAGLAALGNLGAARVTAGAARYGAGLTSQAVREGTLAQSASDAAARALFEKQADDLAKQTELANFRNYTQEQALNRDIASRFNIGNTLSADVFNAGQFNTRGQFDVTRADRNAQYDLVAADRSNLRRLTGGNPYGPIQRAVIDPLQRVTPGRYDPETQTYVTELPRGNA